MQIRWNLAELGRRYEGVFNDILLFYNQSLAPDS